MTDRTDTKAPEEKVCAYEYTVKRGDSFYLIAHRLGVPLRDLLAANPEVNPARLMVGDVLCIPLEEDDRPQEDTSASQVQTAAPSAAESASAAEAPAATGSASAAKAPAAVESTDDMVEDELAESQVEDGALDAPATPGEGPYPDENAVCADSDRYVLQQGETLADVQLSRGLTWHTLERANPTADLAHVQAGESICVPAENIPCDLPRSLILCADDTLDTLALKYNLSVGALLRANPCLAPADFVPGTTITLPQ